jgi:hypothetical protein
LPSLFAGAVGITVGLFWINYLCKARVRGSGAEIPRKTGAACAPIAATRLSLRMQAQTATRFEDILAHVTFTGG